MDMWASAKTMTRGDLRKAFEDYAEAHGQEQATLALERSTGARDVGSVPDGRIINGMVELVAKYSFVCQHDSKTASAHRRLAIIRGDLDRIAIDVWKKRRTPA